MTIRINLLAGERTPQKKKGGGGGGGAISAPSAPGAVQLYLFLALFVGGAIALSVFGWLFKQAQLAELDQQIAEARQRQQQLQVIANEVARYEQQKALLQQKLDTIRDLKSQQGASVRLIDEISKSLPEFVWLENFDQAGTALTFRGKSNSLNAVANFIANLQERTHPPAADGTPRTCAPTMRTGCWFPQVDLSTSTEDDRVVTFAVTAAFQPPPPEVSPEDQAAEGAAEAAPAAGQP
ncbi:MAG TPA: PilN domain-containing protein [Solirubrobacterales bacterium]|nr:PilN domain-containing protein [Solirubrobacterales bacterium]